MKNSRYILLAVFSLSLTLPVHGQAMNTGAGSLSRKFSAYCANNRFEDIYIHCDRDTYVAGENIFFRAYLFDRDSLVLSGTSTYAYVELINPLNRPVAQIKVSLENGKGSSVISIPDTVLNGQYMIRAYTNRMKNFMPYGCFMKSITIINPFSEHFADLDFNLTGGRLDPFMVNFWPEGGKLIAGLPSRLGLYASDIFGNPACFRGVIIDEEGKTVTTVSTDSTGLGLAEFVPRKGIAYTAVSEKDKKKFSLPPVYDDGISIRVTEVSADSLILILMKSDGPQPRYASVELIIRSLGKVLFNNKEFLADRQKIITLPPDVLAEGINDIAVFDDSGKLTAERYIFRPEKNTGKEGTEPDKQYGKREKISIEIKMEADRVSPLYDLSAGIAPASPGKYVLTMNEHLVFGSEYRVENMTYDIAPLFFGSSPGKKEIMMLGLTDNLIDWRKVSTATNLHAGYPAETGGQYLLVSGLQPGVSEEERYKPAFMMSPGKVPELFYSLPDEKNRYLFFIEKGEEEKDIIIQLPDSTSKTGFKVESSFYPGYITTGFQTDTTKPVIPDQIKMMSRNFQVMKIYDIPGIRFKDKASLPVNPKIRFYGKPDRELIMKNYISLPAMQEVFLELIPEVTMRTNNGIVRFHIIDPLTNSILDGKPLLLIDGVRIDDPSIMLNLNPDRVEKIDIIAGEYMVGDLIFPGIINVITKAGDLSAVTLPRNSLRIRYRQFDPPAEYVSPDYSQSGVISKRIPDFRNTLFWKSGLKPAGGGKVVIELNSSDISSDYIINIAGIDGSGKPVSRKSCFSVK